MFTLCFMQCYVLFLLIMSTALNRRCCQSLLSGSVLQKVANRKKTALNNPERFVYSRYPGSPKGQIITN